MTAMRRFKRQRETDENPCILCVTKKGNASTDFNYRRRIINSKQNKAISVSVDIPCLNKERAGRRIHQPKSVRICQPIDKQKRDTGEIKEKAISSSKSKHNALHQVVKGGRETVQVFGFCFVFAFLCSFFLCFIIKLYFSEGCSLLRCQRCKSRKLYFPKTLEIQINK